MANVLAKALASRFSERWQFIDFGSKGRESAVIVDILAVRKCGKPPTLSGVEKLGTFDVQLILVKRGSAALPNFEELCRLRLAQKYYYADRVVPFQWVKGKMSTFSTLGSTDLWVPSTPNQVFGFNS